MSLSALQRLGVAALITRCELRHVSRCVRRFLRIDEAVSALEYAMVVGIIAVAVSAAIIMFSDEYKAPITNIAAKVGAITTPTIRTTP